MKQKPLFDILKGKYLEIDPYKVSHQLHQQANQWYNQYRTARGLQALKTYRREYRYPWQSDIFCDSEMCYPKGQKTQIERQRQQWIKKLKRVNDSIDCLLDEIIDLEKMPRDKGDEYKITVCIQLGPDLFNKP